MNLLTTLVATEAATEPVSTLVFNPANFLHNLQYMGIGMLVIFVIIGVIILATMLTGFLFSNSGK